MYDDQQKKKTCTAISPFPETVKQEKAAKKGLWVYPYAAVAQEIPPLPLIEVGMLL